MTKCCPEKPPQERFFLFYVDTNQPEATRDARTSEAHDSSNKNNDDDSKKKDAASDEYMSICIPRMKSMTASYRCSGAVVSSMVKRGAAGGVGVANAPTGQWHTHTHTHANTNIAIRTRIRVVCISDRYQSKMFAFPKACVTRNRWTAGERLLIKEFVALRNSELEQHNLQQHRGKPFFINYRKSCLKTPKGTFWGACSHAAAFIFGAKLAASAGQAEPWPPD